MGAMENKGLNIFNSKFVLAQPETATDDDYQAIESVIAHEYFHNWTGNRVTCRDWFQLTLKEGLTVFRDQEFSADMQLARRRAHRRGRACAPTSSPRTRARWRTRSAPTTTSRSTTSTRRPSTRRAPRSSACCTPCSAPSGFRRGMDLYFERHDGQAVTCDDFVQAMADASAETAAPISRSSAAGTRRPARRWSPRAAATTRRSRTLHARGRAARRRRRPGSRTRRRSTSRWPSGWSGPTAATCRCRWTARRAPGRDDARAGAHARAAERSTSSTFRRGRCRRCCAASRRRCGSTPTTRRTSSRSLPRTTATRSTAGTRRSAAWSTRSC